MQITLQKLAAPKYLHFSILAIGIILLVVNFYGKELTTTVTNLLYVPTPAFLVILSLIIAFRFRGKGEHGKAWLLFAAFATSWLAAEYIRLGSDLIYNNTDSFPPISHYLYHAGYVFLFLFSIFYIRPVEKAISKKMLAYTFILCMTLLLPTIYVIQSSNPGADSYDLWLVASHPMADAIVMFPAILSLVLFFKGKVNFLWSVMFLAITLNIIADTSTLLSSAPDYHYLRNPLDILYLWGYVLFSFGVHSHIKIFKHYKKNYYANVEDLI